MTDKKQYHKLSVKEVAEHFSTSIESGLQPSEIGERLQKYGPNEIGATKGKGLFKMFLEQMANPVVLILLFAIVMSFLAGDIFESILILAIVVFMAVLGVYLENKAGNAVEKLKSLSSTETSVIRAGKLEKIHSKDVVPGDLLFLVEGDKIPADARVIFVNEASVNEAILTGESVPVSKHANVIDADALIMEQKNVIFSGTFLVQGNLKAIVFSTGRTTEIGKIAEKLKANEEALTPLQIQLQKLGKFLFWATIIICFGVFALSVWRGDSIVKSMVQSLALAIAFIPEGLTAVMTVVLALGVREMVKKGVIIKNLLAAEGMGSVAVIMTDKTGTITKGHMSVELISISGQEILPKDFRQVNEAEKLIADIIRFCNNGKGPTESALIGFLEKDGVVFELEERHKEHRFSSDLKRMSIVKKVNDRFHSYSKGAPDVLIPMCHHYVDYQTGKSQEMTKQRLQEFLDEAEKLAQKGYRVLSVAYKQFAEEEDIENREHAESKLIFTGLIALLDPLKPEVKDTVAQFKSAGIRPVMITGDHPAIAKTIALQAGFYMTEEEAFVITGRELDEFFEEGKTLTEERIKDCRVFARVTPDHKNKIVDLYQNSGVYVAMAGDGVNDAVAIRRAKIGIAVANATDIVKETAQVIVTGSYDALGRAVEIGRMIMIRTRLYLYYLLSGNLCQVGVFILALAFGLPLPLTAIMLLTINVLTDAAPAMAMAFEKRFANLMNQPPKPIKEGIINAEMYKSIAVIGILSSILLFAVFTMYLPYGLLYAQTATFTAYIFQKLLRGFTARSFSESILSYGIFSNIPMLLAVVFGFGVWGFLVYGIPGVFEMQPLPFNTILALGGLSLTIPVAEEIIKYLKRKRVKLFL